MVVIEVGTHSPWVSRLLTRLGHTALPANPRRLPYLTRHDHKNDRTDAETLARLGRWDPQLLHSVTHRGEQAQADLAVIRARDGAVRARADLINHVRGAVKAIGERLPACSAESFHRQAAVHLPVSLGAALEPLLQMIGELTRTVRGYDRAIEQIAGRYPAVRLLTPIRGVGMLTALTYVLVIDDPRRFVRSRQVGAYLGLTPRQRASGTRDPELAISKAGDQTLRRLLVQCAHYLLGPFGEDCDLRRWGLRLAGEGSRTRKKRAVVAVARKLAVLLHRLWVSGDVYDPLYRSARAA